MALEFPRRSREEKIARREASGFVALVPAALKGRDTSDLAPLQGASLVDVCPRRFTSGYYLSAALPPIEVWLLRESTPYSSGFLLADGFSGVFAGVAGVLAGLAAGFTSGTGVAAVFELAGGLGVGDCFGGGVGVTGQSSRPLGVIVHPAGMSCINGLCPGGIFIVFPPGPIYVCGGAPGGGAVLVAHGL